MQESDYDSRDNSSETEWKVSSIVLAMDSDWEIKEME
jgi:hypothetical protein